MTAFNSTTENLAFLAVPTETKSASKRVIDLRDANYQAITFMEEELFYVKRAMSRLLEEVSKSDSFEALKEHWELCHERMQWMDEAERAAYSGACDCNEGLNDLSDELRELELIADEKVRGSWRIEMMQELYGL